MSLFIPGGAQFTSEASAADAYIWLGYEPDFVILIANSTATSPDVYLWPNTKKFTQWQDSDGDGDDVLKITGTTGVITKVDDGIAAHLGGTAITASNDQSHFKADGTNPVAGDVSQKGIVVKAGIQTNSGENFLIALRLSNMVSPV